MKAGNLVFTLHTHLPYVMNHDYLPHGEAWLYEAASECYIPLLNVMNELYDEGIKAKLTIDISPVLAEQLASPRFKEKYIEYCDNFLTAIKEDRAEFIKTNANDDVLKVNKFWEEWYSERKKDFIEKYNSSIISGLKDLQDKGVIEMMTCGATHGYFPLLGLDKSIDLQIKTAKKNHKKHFGKDPDGIWLPECAYRPEYEWQTYFKIPELNTPHSRKGVEQLLSENDIKYFMSDEKFVRELKAIGKFNEFEKKDFHKLGNPDFKEESWNFHNDPLNLYNVASNENVSKGTAAVFARHKELSMLVWSGETGYPGNGAYLDFHKKHGNSHVRYWSVTDTKIDMAYKRLYDPEAVWETLDMQTNHFIHNIENTVNFYKRQTGKDALLSLSFDTELFGHWWFEGPMFIKYLIKGLNESPYIDLTTANEAYKEYKPRDIIKIKEGSWGKNNNHDVWINEGNKWTWEKIYKAEIRFDKIVSSRPINKFPKIIKRVLLQAMRELLLMQSSDWQFLIDTGQAWDYAEKRFHCHHDDFEKLCEIADRLLLNSRSRLKKDEKMLLENCEQMNNLFEELDLKNWG